MKSDSAISIFSEIGLLQKIEFSSFHFPLFSLFRIPLYPWRGIALWFKKDHCSEKKKKTHDVEPLSLCKGTRANYWSRRALWVAELFSECGEKRRALLRMRWEKKRLGQLSSDCSGKKRIVQLSSESNHHVSTNDPEASANPSLVCRLQRSWVGDSSSDSSCREDAHPALCFSSLLPRQFFSACWYIGYFFPTIFWFLFDLLFKRTMQWYFL